MKTAIGFVVAGIIGVAVLVLDPIGYFEDDHGDGYWFNAVAMRTVAEGTWKLTDRDGRSYRLSFRQADSLQRTGVPRPAATLPEWSHPRANRVRL